MLSKKTKYGLKALAFIARQEKGNYGTNSYYFRK